MNAHSLCHICTPQTAYSPCHICTPQLPILLATSAHHRLPIPLATSAHHMLPIPLVTSAHLRNLIPLSIKGKCLFSCQICTLQTAYSPCHICQQHTSLFPWPQGPHRNSIYEGNNNKPWTCVTQTMQQPYATTRMSSLENYGTGTIGVVKPAPAPLTATCYSKYLRS